MNVWLTSTAIAVVFFCLLIPLLLAPWINAQYRRFGRIAGWPAVISAATVLYVCALVAFTMFPLPEASSSFCTERRLIDYWQTTPFASLDDVYLVYQSSGLAAMLTSGVFLQVFFNVVFFVPLGFLLAHRWRRGFLSTAAIGLAVSLLIEATQGTGVWGAFPCPYRLADVDDLITNLLGALIGWALARVVNRWLPDPRPAELPDLAAPGLPRRVLAAGLDLLTFALVAVGIATVTDLFRHSLHNNNANALEASRLGFGITQAFVILILMVVIPACRTDRATPGVASVDCAAASRDGQSGAQWWQLLIRAAIRFGPIPILGPIWILFGFVDLTVALLRKDRRTFTDLASGTTLITKRRMQADRDAPVGPTIAEQTSGS